MGRTKNKRTIIPIYIKKEMKPHRIILRKCRCLLFIAALCGMASTANAQSEPHENTAAETAYYAESAGEILSTLANVAISNDTGFFDSIDTKSLESFAMLKISETHTPPYSDMDEEEKKQTAGKWVQRYLTEELYQQMSTMIAPHIQQSITKDQLDECLRLTRSLKNSMTRLEKTIEKEMGTMSNAMDQCLESGKQPAPIQSKECTENYKTLFEEFYEASEIGQTLESNLIKPLELLLALASTSDETAEIRQAKAAVNYMKGNLKTAMFNACAEALSEDDLRILTGREENASMQAFAHALESCPAQPDMALRIFQDFNRWLDKRIKEEPSHTPDLQK